MCLGNKEVAHLGVLLGALPTFPLEALALAGRVRRGAVLHGEVHIANDERLLLSSAAARAGTAASAASAQLLPQPSGRRTKASEIGSAAHGAAASGGVGHGLALQHATASGTERMEDELRRLESAPRRCAGDFLSPLSSICVKTQILAPSPVRHVLVLREQSLVIPDEFVAEPTERSSIVRRRKRHYIPPSMARGIEDIEVLGTPDRLWHVDRLHGAR
mmetsp:Transcript_102109/g.218646  ORF Transcript_102109/g.218646 Transcript_102109/m.218646 type:complete len:218 (-) Transcript_102109:172-825(-)